MSKPILTVEADCLAAATLGPATLAARRRMLELVLEIQCRVRCHKLVVPKRRKDQWKKIHAQRKKMSTDKEKGGRAHLADGIKPT
jgi:hypothetical protein